MELLVIVLIFLLVGIIAGFVGGRSLIKRHIDNSNQVNEEMIKGLFIQMGMKPNQKKINKVMKAIEKDKK